MKTRTKLALAATAVLAIVLLTAQDSLAGSKFTLKVGAATAGRGGHTRTGRDVGSIRKGDHDRDRDRDNRRGDKGRDGRQVGRIGQGPLLRRTAGRPVLAGQPKVILVRPMPTPPRRVVIRPLPAPRPIVIRPQICLPSQAVRIIQICFSW